MGANRLDNAPLGRMSTSAPIYAFGSIVIFLGAIVLLIVTGHEDDTGAAVIALCLANIPTLVAALFSERAARDIRNGLVEEKAKQGAVAAIEEKNVVLSDGPSTNVQIDALRAILNKIHEDTTVTREHVEGGE